MIVNGVLVRKGIVTDDLEEGQPALTIMFLSIVKATFAQLYPRFLERDESLLDAL